MLTARGAESDRVAGLELGADDYIVKPFSAREVMARVRAVLRRATAPQSGDGDGPIKIGGLSLDTARHEAQLDGRAIELSRKEFELLKVLMENAGSVLTRETLIDEVWDMNWFGSTKTLDVHVSGLRKKLGDDPKEPRYIHTVRGVGSVSRAPTRSRSMSLRARLLAAFAYTLIVVIVALEVPLSANVSDRVNAQVEADSAAQAQVVAASVADQLRTPARLQQVATQASTRLDGLVFIIDGLGQDRELGPQFGDAPTAADRRSDRGAGARRERRAGAPPRGPGRPLHGGADRPQRPHDRRAGGRAEPGRGPQPGSTGRVRPGRHRRARPGAGAGRRLDPRGLHREAVRSLGEAARRRAGGESEARAPERGSSEQVEVAHEFNEMADRVEAVLESQRAFVADASHQLRTPLTGSGFGSRPRE